MVTFKFTDSGTCCDNTHPANMLAHIQNKLDPTYNQHICIFAYACFDYVTRKKSISIMMIVHPFNYYFQILSGDKELWMLIYMGSTFRRVFNLGTGTVGKICVSFSPSGRRMLYHEDILRKISPSLN
jgi:hypothetical protein